MVSGCITYSCLPLSSVVGALVVGLVVTAGVVVSVQWKTTLRPSTLQNKPLELQYDVNNYNIKEIHCKHNY